MELTLNILLVEDNPGDVELIKEMMEQPHIRNSTIIEARNLEQAISKLQEDTFDIILLDLGLPDSAGLMTLTDILQYAKKIPVVVLTGLDDESLAVDAIRKGAEDYLPKNKMDAEVLLRVLRYAIERKRVREALHASEKKYRYLVNEINDGIYNSDIDGNFTFTNNALCSLLGYEEEELIGKPFRELIIPDERERFITLYKDTLKTGKSHGVIEVPIQDNNGNSLVIEIKPVVIKRGGKPVGSRGVVRDVTQRKQWETQLQASENRYRSFVENFHGIAFRSSLDWIPLYFHGAVKEITGYTEAEFINGKPRWDQIIYKDDLEKLMTPESQEGIKQVGYVAEREYRIVTKCGEIKWLHDYIQTVYDDLLGENILQGALYDITDRKKAEEALILGERQIRFQAELLQNAPMIAAFHDKDLNMVWANNAYEKATGSSLAEMKNRKCYSVWNLSRPCRNCPVMKAIETGESHEAELTPQNQDHWPESQGCWLSKAAPVRERDGSIIGAIEIAINITELKQAEEELKMNRERLKTATSILRHDIINDLSVIKSAVDIYRDEHDETMIDEIEKRVKKTIETINNQRDQVKFLDAHAELDEYNLEEVLYNVLKNYPCLEMTISGSGKVYADNAIYSVCENIISNAIKHGKNKKIDIDIVPDKEYCEVRFKDYGTGIPDEIKDKIFDEGFHYGKSGHTGIGLFIVKKTIEEYGGEVSVKDNKPSGAIFVIRLKKTVER